MIAKPGSRWRSAVDETEVVVVRAPAGEVALECGGAPLLPIDQSRTDGTPDPAHAQGTLVGKRYVDADETVEVLCTSGGEGSLALGGVPLNTKGAKPLPSSD